MSAILKAVLLAAICSTSCIAGSSQVVAPGSGNISGTLTGKDGSPLDHVRVTAMAVADPGAADPETAVLVSLAQTDSRGRYVLENVPPGRYYITAGLVSLPTYYPGVASRANAAVVELSSGANLMGIDFSASPVSSIGGAVSGHVVLSNLPGTQTVLLSGQSLTTGNLSLQTSVQADGRFSFPLIPAGRYRLQPFGPGNVFFGQSSVQIEVGDKDVSDIQIGAQTAMIVGHIVTEDGSPLPPLPREANSQTLAVTAEWSTGRESTSIQAGGMFVLMRPSDEIKVGINSLPLGFTIKSISYGGRNLVSGLLKIDGPPKGEILITLTVTPHDAVVGAKVSGRAIHIPAELARKYAMFRLTFPGGPLLETALKEDGSFEFPKVPNGTYTLFFLAPTGRLANPPIVVNDTDIRDLEVDLRNNPFPEFPGASFGSGFSNSGQITLHGVITESPVQLRSPAPSHYLRMEIDPALQGSTHWAVMFSVVPAGASAADPNLGKLKVGTHITVDVIPDRDGSPRGILAPQTGPNTVLGMVLDSP